MKEKMYQEMNLRQFNTFSLLPKLPLKKDNWTEKELNNSCFFMPEQCI